MYTECQVTGQGPGSGGPGHEADSRVLVDGEADEDGRVGDVVVILVNLKVRERGVAGGGVGHYFETFVHETFSKHL